MCRQDQARVTSAGVRAGSAASRERDEHEEQGDLDCKQCLSFNLPINTSSSCREQVLFSSVARSRAASVSLPLHWVPPWGLILPYPIRSLPLL